jgi:RNA polymerase sigma-70 factor, ECF subfamily
MLNEVLFIKRLQAGDNIAFQELINEFGPRLFRAARLLNADEQAAEELVSDTLADAFVDINQFKYQASLFSWLYRILLNNFYDQLRHRKREASFKDSFLKSMTQSGGVVDHELKVLSDFQQHLPVLLSKLSGEHREIILLKFLEGMKIKEIAEALKIPENTVKARIRRALIKSRKIMKRGNLLPD